MQPIIQTMTISYILRKAALCTVLAAVALALSSCAVDDTSVTDGGPSYNSPEIGVAYVGKWKAGTLTAADSWVMVFDRYFQVGSMPCGEVLAQLFPGKAITDARCDAGSGRLTYVSAEPNANSTLYSLQPTSLGMTADIDGVPCSVRLAIAPVMGSDDYMSWGSLSRTGVLTIILHATSYTVNGGEAQPLELKLTFTGKR